MFLETVTGTNGVIPPPDGYLQSIREVCDRHGILLVLDEVMAGFGRTGRWFACDNWDVVPDILTVAKGINSGYVPLGAMIIGPRLREWVRGKYFPGGLTYAGHPLACASAVASIEAFREEGVVENAAEAGSYLGDGLRGLAAAHPSIGEVRGLGCFWGVELVKSRETREMLVPFNASGEAAAPVARLAKAALERGLYLMTHWNVIMVVPPLTVTSEEVDEGLVILDEVAGDDDDLEQIAQGCAVRLEQVIVREVGLLAQDEQRRHMYVLERRWSRRHLAVRRDDGGLAVAVAIEPLVVRDEMRSKLLLDELSRRALQLAFDVALLDRFLEGDVRSLSSCVLGGEERDLGWKVDRRIEQDEPPSQVRRSGSELEREAPAERVPDEGRPLVADDLLDRVEMRLDVPWRLVRRGAVPEEVRREHVEVVEGVLGEHREVTPVACDPV